MIQYRFKLCTLRFGPLGRTEQLPPKSVIQSFQLLTPHSLRFLNHTTTFARWKSLIKFPRRGHSHYLQQKYFSMQTSSTMYCLEKSDGIRPGVNLWILLFLSMVSVTHAYNVPSVSLASSLYRNPESYGSSDDSCVMDPSLVKTGSWRVALNLGREFSTPLLDSYGTSGIRFPVVIPCDFTSDRSVTPLTNTVSYVADVTGGVTKPVLGGSWKIPTNSQRLEFTMSFPEELKKKDISIPPGSQLVMEVNLISTKALKQLELAFTEARKEEWKALEKIDEIQAVRNSPKRWNEETQRWEYPRIEEPLSSLFSKHWEAFVKGQERRKKFAEKPRSGVELSKRPGQFPGFAKDDLVYFRTDGIIRNKSKGNMVVGTWTAEPIDSMIQDGVK